MKLAHIDQPIFRILLEEYQRRLTNGERNFKCHHSFRLTVDGREADLCFNTNYVEQTLTLRAELLKASSFLSTFLYESTVHKAGSKMLLTKHFENFETETFKVLDKLKFSNFFGLYLPVDEAKMILERYKEYLKYENCPVCMEETMSMTSCNHFLCVDCEQKIIEKEMPCPICRACLCCGSHKCRDQDYDVNDET